MFCPDARFVARAPNRDQRKWNQPTDLAAVAISCPLSSGASNGMIVTDMIAFRPWRAVGKATGYVQTLHYTGRSFVVWRLRPSKRQRAFVSLNEIPKKP